MRSQTYCVVRPKGDVKYKRVKGGMWVKGGGEYLDSEGQRYLDDEGRCHLDDEGRCYLDDEGRCYLDDEGRCYLFRLFPNFFNLLILILFWCTAVPRVSLNNAMREYQVSCQSYFLELGWECSAMQ